MVGHGRPWLAMVSHGYSLSFESALQFKPTGFLLSLQSFFYFFLSMKDIVGGDKRKRSNRYISRLERAGKITKAKAAEKYIRNPPSKSSKLTAVPDTSWQYKGVGKGGSLGTPVDAISQSTDKAEEPNIPEPLAAYTEEEIRNMFGDGDDANYCYPSTPFWDGVSYHHIQRGTHCLWKSVARGKHGGPSTKVEYFHGVVHGWHNNDYVIIS